VNLFSYLLDAANWPGPDGIATRIGEHLGFTVISVLVATMLGVVIGAIAGRYRAGRVVVVGVLNATRAIPTLGLLVLVVTLLGTGLVPVLLALVILALPPILTGTATGVAQADPNAVQAAKGLGMTGLQVSLGVELPLALPLIISGIRSATLQVVATATVAALAAAGGLGRLVVDGQRAGATGYPEMFAGAVLVAVMAVLFDVILGLLVRVARRRAERHAETSLAAPDSLDPRELIPTPADPSTP